MTCEDRQRGLGHGPCGQRAFGELLNREGSEAAIGGVAGPYFSYREGLAGGCGFCMLWGE